MTDIRRIAYEALLLAEEKDHLNSLSKDVLEKYSYLPAIDKSFLKRLIEGVTERRITLDYVIDLRSKVPSSKMKKQIRTIIRMGTYQLLFMEKVADHAAVNESVKLARKAGFSTLSGFVNGVLRNIAKNRDTVEWPDINTDRIRHFSVKYSTPEWIVKKLLDEQTEENATALLALSVSVRPVTARVNLTKTTVNEVAADKRITPSDIIPEAVILSDYDSLTDIDALKDGRICIQDLSSVLALHISGIKSTDKILDLCAAPGGKSLHAADLARQGHVISCDVSDAKLEKIRENIERCGFMNIETGLNDASVFNEEWEEKFDVVIADVPCSGLGVMGRKNDIRYNVTPDSVKSLAALQKSILKNAARYVKRGGILLFTTCTCTAEENAGNFRFLTDELKLTGIDFYDDIPDELKDVTAKDGYLQLYGKDSLTDGFFISKHKR